MTKATDLEVELAAATGAHAALTPEDAARARALADENAAFVQAQDVAAFAGAVARKARHERRRQAARFGGLALLPSACALLLVVTLHDGGGDVVRDKGRGPALSGALITSTNSAPLTSGVPAHPGDVVQLRLDGLPAGHEAVVVSIDGRGNVTLHHPQAKGAALGPGGLLPSSFELDDAPGFERFIAVIGAHVDVDVVVAAARETGRAPDSMHAALALPASLVQVDLLVGKVGTR
jgi:hypothetical protein